jgi:hypothetical protein
MAPEGEAEAELGFADGGGGGKRRQRSEPLIRSAWIGRRLAAPGSTWAKLRIGAVDGVMDRTWAFSARGTPVYGSLRSGRDLAWYFRPESLTTLWIRFFFA